MTPNRRAKINGMTIEQFYWAGEYVTYVNNRLHWGTFDDAVREAQATVH